MADLAEWLPAVRLTNWEAHQYAIRLQRALGAAWYVTVFPLTGNRIVTGLADTNVEIRPARPPMRPAVVLRTAFECEVYLADWVAAHGEQEPAPPKRAEWHVSRYAGQLKGAER
jgi:hypothetical protein